MKKNLLSGIGFVLFFLSLVINSSAIGYNADLGTISSVNPITRSGSTSGMSNVYGNGSPDYVYRIYIPWACTLEVNTCGCGWDSYLHVLDASDTRLAYDDDACGSASSRISGLSIPSAGYYYIVVDGYSGSNSGAYTLTIIATGGTTTLNGGTISIGTSSVSPNSSPGTFTSSAAASGGTGTYSYQWQQSADNSTWTNISGQTAATYTVPGLTTSTYYRRMVTSGSYTAYSNTVLITVIPPTLSGGTISIGTSSVSPNSSPGTFTSSAAASGGTGSYAYQWQQSADNSTWTTISGQTAATYTVPGLTASTYYRRMVTSGSYTAYSNTVLITVTTATLSGGTISISSSSVCSGSSPGTIANSVSPSGGTGSYTYQWYQSPDNSNWSVISGAGVLTFPVPSLTSTTYFRRLTLSGTLAAYSNTVVITVTSCGGSVTSVNSMTGAVTLGLSASASGTQRTIAITGGTGAAIDVADNDNSPTNEIQSLSVSGSTLSISGGNSVTLPAATYPAAGLALSTGSGWGTSVTNNSANWNLAYSWGNHAGLYRPISYVPAWSEVSSKPTTVSGYGITDAMTTSHAANSITSTNIAAWNAKQGALILTTNGTSGAATLSGNTLNIPQYSGGSGGSSQWTTSSSNIYYTAGAVSIGTTSFPSGYKLAVAGKIITDEVMVKTATSWPDYVFGADYRLRSLSETETFIQKNGHLPEVPDAAHVKENGVGLSEMDQILLKKVEEMTLYIIQLEKRVKDLEKNDGPISGKQ